MRAEAPPPGVDLTEAPFELPDRFKKAVIDKLYELEWRRYPALRQPEVKEKVASFFGIDPGAFLLTRGADEALRLAFQHAGSRGAALALPDPGFFGFLRTARALGVEFDHYHVPGELPSASLLRLPVLCSPNNPSGHALSMADVQGVCARSEGGAGPLLDLTYDFFADRPLHKNLNELLSFGVISCISFSKSFALAGARVGMLVATPEIIEEVAEKNDRFGLDYFQLAVLDTLFDRRWDRERESMVEWVRSTRSEMVGILSDLLPGDALGPCQGNFIPVHISGVPDTFVRDLVEATACKVHPSSELLRITVNDFSLAGIRKLRSGPALAR
ncbi:pyridoxal phosphate-dependent aminotransferase [Streptosporangium sandarakinum]